MLTTELPNLNGYYGLTAQRTAVSRCARRRKLVRCIDLRNHVIKQLAEGWSPEQIAGRLKYDGQSLRVSHETIYAYAYGPDGQSEELARYLPHRQKKRQPRHRRTPRGLVFPPDRSIISSAKACHAEPDLTKGETCPTRVSGPSPARHEWRSHHPVGPLHRQKVLSRRCKRRHLHASCAGSPSHFLCD